LPLVAVSGVFLVLVTAACAGFLRARPFLATGWL
jgi:hypothetical protein